VLSISKAKYDGPLFEKNIKQVTDKAIKKRLSVIAEVVRGQISSRAPVGTTGTLMGSIVPRVFKRMNVWVARIGSPQLYASVIEFGRKVPGKMPADPGEPPPAKALIHWVQRKLSITDPKKAKRVAWVIAQRIAQKGFKSPHKSGWKMFEKGLRHSRSFIKRELGKVSIDLARKL
jgi:hypothetical protein